MPSCCILLHNHARVHNTLCANQVIAATSAKTPTPTRTPTPSHRRPRRAEPRAQAPPCRTEPSSHRPRLHRRPTVSAGRVLSLPTTMCCRSCRGPGFPGARARIHAPSGRTQRPCLWLELGLANLRRRGPATPELRVCTATTSRRVFPSARACTNPATAHATAKGPTSAPF
jgi:hypothetical protein